MPYRIMPPARWAASRTVTRWPSRSRWYAAASPAGPAPTTSTCMPAGRGGTGTVHPRRMASSPRNRSTALMPTASSSWPRLQAVWQGW